VTTTPAIKQCKNSLTAHMHRKWPQLFGNWPHWQKLDYTNYMKDVFSEEEYNKAKLCDGMEQTHFIWRICCHLQFTVCGKVTMFSC